MYVHSFMYSSLVGGSLWATTAKSGVVKQPTFRFLERATTTTRVYSSEYNMLDNVHHHLIVILHTSTGTTLKRKPYISLCSTMGASGGDMSNDTMYAFLNVAIRPKSMPGNTVVVPQTASHRVHSTCSDNNNNNDKKKTGSGR